MAFIRRVVTLHSGKYFFPPRETRLKRSPFDAPLQSFRQGVPPPSVSSSFSGQKREKMASYVRKKQATLKQETNTRTTRVPIINHRGLVSLLFFLSLPLSSIPENGIFLNKIFYKQCTRTLND